VSCSRVQTALREVVLLLAVLLLIADLRSQPSSARARAASPPAA
jgi:hypothetical protein